MPTIPRKWPAELESEREYMLQAATEAAQFLLDAQHKLDTARDKVRANPNLVLVLLSESDRAVYNALARLERIQRYIAVCKGASLGGRWPSVAMRQRDQAAQAVQQASDALEQAQETLVNAIDKSHSNPGLVETMIATVSHRQARALMLVERVARLMTEAAVGRE